MSVHLSGGPVSGGPTPEAASAFCEEARRSAADAGRRTARIAVVSVGDAVATGARAVVGVGVEEVGLHVAVGETADLPHLAETDGLIVQDGVPEEILAALDPISGEIRRRVWQGWPYLGVGAGAVLAAETSVLGGHRIGDVTVSPDDGRGELRLEHGLGLIDVSVDAGTAEQGTLSRLVAAVEAGLIPAGLGVDRGTVLTVGSGALDVAGTGSVWRVTPGESGVTVSTVGAD